MHDPHDPYGALRVGDYRRLLAGNVLAAVGSEMLAVAVGWELYSRTGSAWNLGLVGLAQFLPVLLLGLPAGQAADRYSRKGLLMSAQGLMALAALGLALLSEAQGHLALVYACLVLTGVARAFIMPSRFALLSQIVPSHLLSNAVTWNSSGWQVASVSGPALGGLVLAVSPHYAGAYAFAALGALTCVALLATTRPRPVERTAGPRSLESLLAGVRFVFREKLILAAITLDLFAVLLGGATALLPIFAKDILAVGPVGLGALRAAPSLGAFVTAILIAHRPPFRRAGRALLWSVAGFGLATIGFGLSESFWLSFALLAALGALDNVSVVVRGTLVQVLTPDEMRGRVSAVNAIFISSSNELGAFESGTAAEFLGPVLAVVAGGVGTIAVVVAAVFTWPELLSLGPLHRARRREPDGEAVRPEGSSVAG